MTIEDRLRRALHAEASGVEANPAAWREVQQDVARRGRGGTRRRVGVGALALAAMMAAALAAVALIGGDDAQQIDVGPPAGDGTRTTAPAPTPADDGVFPGIWPFSSQEQLDYTIGHASEVDDWAFDAQGTALEFARTYLGMPNPEARGEERTARASARRHVAILVAPTPESPLGTWIAVEQFGGDDGPYSVVGATTENIQVETPEPGDVVAGEVRVRGRSTAFEATVQVEVREDDRPDPLGRSFVMGGSMGEMGAFDGTIAFDPPSQRAGAVVFYTDSAEDGSVQEATVVRIGFSDEETTSFSVFFHRGEELVEIERTVPHTTGVLRAALDALFEGPRPQDGDVTSFFSSQTSDLLGDVTVNEDGTAVVELTATVPNANSSAGSQAFLASLNATVFQFPTVERAEYRLEGSCDAFWEWLQYGECQVVPRP